MNRNYRKWVNRERKVSKSILLITAFIVIAVLLTSAFEPMVVKACFLGIIAVLGVILGTRIYWYSVISSKLYNDTSKGVE